MKMLLPHTKSSWLLLLGLVLSMTTAQAVTTSLSFSDALGIVISGEPADNVSETKYVNSLVARANGTDPTPYDVAGKVYALSNNPAAILPLAVYDNSVQTPEGSTGDPVTIDVTGFTYLLAKYDGPNGADYVWVVTGLTTVEIQKFFQYNDNGAGQLALSHYSLFNSGPVSVPEGGATIALLALACGGFALFRRHLA